MNRINLLSSKTSNKIAAGEVVERPFSVVKELVENSIDATAENIIIEIVEGGHKKIKIIDDGIGIYPEDIEKAFMPHATSKIKGIDDIYKINTMGFRGEALSSIAAVSKVKLISRVEKFKIGKEIYIEGGELKYIRDIGCNVGTIVEVEDLFFNVPARLKFLKSWQREAALISDVINKLALANKEVSFKLINNEKKVLNTFSTDNLKETIRYVYGKNIYENINFFEKHIDIMSVYGFIGNQDISRRSRSNQSIFVNKRYIKSKLITVAVENAFKSFLTVNKFPFFTLFIDIFPEYIDVNVHPTKTEIKFTDERAIFKVVFDAVHEGIRNSLKDSFKIELNEKKTIEPIDFKSMEVVQIPLELKKEKKELFFENLENLNDITAQHYCDNELKVYNKDNKIVLKDSLNDFKNQDYDMICDVQNVNKEIENSYKLPYLRIIGQYAKTYILCEADDGLYVIDQHAAHEKILFEKYSDEIRKSQIISQILIVPEIMELSYEDFAYYSENKVIFNNTGFNIEVFGENTISIREVPLILGKPDIKNLFLEILDNLKNMGSGETVEVKYCKIASLACKSAVKANDKLDDLEIKALIDKLGYIRDPFTCPHGRPTIIKVTLNELEKRFKRIQ